MDVYTKGQQTTPSLDLHDKQFSVAEIVRSLEAKVGIRSASVTKTRKAKAGISGHNLILQSDTETTTNTNKVASVSSLPKQNQFVPEEVISNQKERVKTKPNHLLDYNLLHSVQCSNDDIVKSDYADSALRREQQKSNNSHNHTRTVEPDSSDLNKKEIHQYRKHVERTYSSEIEVDPSSCYDPHEYWESVMKDQVPVRIVTPLDPNSEIRKNCLRLVDSVLL